MMLSVLHLSDLHRDPFNPIGNQVLLDSLQRDRDRYTSTEDPLIRTPNLIVVSGDIVQGVQHGTSDAQTILEGQYDEALAFLNSLVECFVEGDKQRIIIVPGNHDVSDHLFRDSLASIDIAGTENKELVAQLHRADSALRWSWDELSFYEIVDWPTYDRRMKPFSNFYSAFYDGQRQYSVDPSKQVDVFSLPTFDIVVVGFSSCYRNDLLNRQGAIHPDCIAAAGADLRKIVRSNNPLRIAVWHHNTEGPPFESDYMDPDVVQNLIDGGFSLGFHGHQHRPQFLDTRFRHGPDRHMTVISAGTLCGGAAQRFGRAYNIVEIDTDNNTGRLHTREMQNDNLQMPIWGARSTPPNQSSYRDFKFDPPPDPFVKPDRETVQLGDAQKLYDVGNYREAADILKPLSTGEPLARRLLLDCLVKLNDHSAIRALADPPGSPAETLALMDALWQAQDMQRLREILELDSVSTSRDPSVIEMSTKYRARLRT